MPSSPVSSCRSHCFRTQKLPANSKGLRCWQLKIGHKIINRKCNVFVI
jgi:hypothetical protein